MRPETVGLIVNPVAGLGAQRNLDLARQVIEALKPDRVLTGPGQLGGMAVPAAEIMPTTLSRRAATQFLAREAAQAGMAAIVVVGGDGTMADVAFALVEGGCRCPILGIGAGSTNVGSLISCQAADITHLAGCQFSPTSIDGLLAGCNETLLALAFNDVVIGTTVVGTIDGELVDLDALERLAGNSVIGQPRPLGAGEARVVKQSPGRTAEVASGLKVGTVIVGFSHGRHFYGKAITGGVCLTAVVGLPAGCLVCEQPLVRVRLAANELLEAEPVQSTYVSLAEADAIQVSGLEAPAVLCADGNPLKWLEPEDRVQIRVRLNLVEILRPI